MNEIIIFRQQLIVLLHTHKPYNTRSHLHYYYLPRRPYTTHGTCYTSFMLFLFIIFFAFNNNNHWHWIFSAMSWVVMISKLVPGMIYAPHEIRRWVESIAKCYLEPLIWVIDIKTSNYSWIIIIFGTEILQLISFHWFSTKL